MIVYTTHLWWGLVGAATVGVVLGICIGFWWDDFYLRAIALKKGPPIITFTELPCRKDQ